MRDTTKRVMKARYDDLKAQYDAIPMQVNQIKAARDQEVAQLQGMRTTIKDEMDQIKADLDAEPA